MLCGDPDAACSCCLLVANPNPNLGQDLRPKLAESSRAARRVCLPIAALPSGERAAPLEVLFRNQPPWNCSGCYLYFASRKAGNFLIAKEKFWAHNEEPLPAAQIHSTNLNILPGLLTRPDQNRPIPTGFHPAAPTRLHWSDQNFVVLRFSWLFSCVRMRPILSL